MFSFFILRRRTGLVVQTFITKCPWQHICCLTVTQKRFSLVFYQAEEFTLAQHARKFSVALKILKESDVIEENKALLENRLGRVTESAVITTASNRR